MNVQTTVTLRAFSEQDILLALKAFRGKINGMDLDARIAAADTMRTPQNTHAILMLRHLAKILDSK
jgi:hypothetical protein